MTLLLHKGPFAMAVFCWPCFLGSSPACWWGGQVPRGGGGRLGAARWICWGFALGQGFSGGREKLLVSVGSRSGAVAAAAGTCPGRDLEELRGGW